MKISRPSSKSRRCLLALLALAPLPAFAQLTPAGLDPDVAARPRIECDLQPQEVPESLWNANLWTSGRVYYSFNANVNTGNRAAMLVAMDALQTVANIQFIARTNEPNYINIQDSTGNNSAFGMIGGVQIVNIFNWNFRYIMAHELMHALGVWHEQSRSDRANYVNVNFANIQPAYAGNYNIQPGAAPLGAYDFASIMHYDPCGFSVCCPAGFTCGCATSCAAIQALPAYAQFQSLMGNRSYLSQGDKDGLANRYGAPIDDGYEPNNSIAAAASLPIGAPVSLKLWDTDDFFSFQVFAASTITVSAAAGAWALDADPGDGLQTSMILYQAASAQVGATTFTTNGGSGSVANISYAVTPGTYYIRLNHTQFWGGSYTLNVTGLAQSNDLCANATVIGSLPFTGTQGTTFATITPGETLASCRTTGRSVWHTFTADAYYNVTANTLGSDFDTVLSATTACTGGTDLACDDDSAGGLLSTISFSVAPGSTTYLRTASFGSRVGGNLVLNVTGTIVAPSNDLKANAIALNPAGQTLTGTTIGATNDFPGGATCGFSGASDDVWYTLTLPSSDCNASYTVSTISNITNYDTVLTAYAGPITALSEIACNDDSLGFQAAIAFSAVAGRTYYIRVSGYNSATGRFSLSLTRGANVSDECATAVPLVVGTTPYHSTCFTDTAGLANTGCGSGTIYKDGWYTVSFPTEQNVTVDTFGSTIDTQLALYDVACPTAATTPIACNDDSNSTLQSRISLVATANRLYFARAGVYYGGNYGGDAVINMTATPTAPACLADVNADGVVDGGDFTAFINSFGVGDPTVDPTADVNLDGVVDGDDFVAFINAFGAGC